MRSWQVIYELKAIATLSGTKATSRGGTTPTALNLDSNLISTCCRMLSYYLLNDHMPR